MAPRSPAAHARLQPLSPFAAIVMELVTLWQGFRRSRAASAAASAPPEASAELLRRPS